MNHEQEDRIEVLLERVVGRDERLDDWRELREVARRSPEVWATMADRLESDTELRVCLEQSAVAGEDLAGPVSLPFADEVVDRPAKRTSAQAFGWLAAVLVAALWIADRTFLSDVPPIDRGSAPITGPMTVGGGGVGGEVATVQDGERPLQPRPVSDEGHLERRVLETLPSVLIRSVRRPDGRVEVVYLKRQVERRFVEDVETLHADDGGAPFARQATPAVLVGGRQDH